MNKKTAVVITSIAPDSNLVLHHIARGVLKHNVELLIVGDTKSPVSFELDGAEFWSAQKQQTLSFSLAAKLPFKTYARKNIGYLLAAAKGVEVIVEKPLICHYLIITKAVFILSKWSRLEAHACCSSRCIRCAGLRPMAICKNTCFTTRKMQSTSGTIYNLEPISKKIRFVYALNRLNRRMA